MSHPIIALWSHPRSMSTAFERIMRARGDLVCLHEPFMYDYYLHRAKRQMPHFVAEPGHPRSYGEIRDMILAKAEQGPVFFKDMSYYVMPHILDDAAFVRRLTHSFLIRDPKASLVSYARIDPDLTSEEVGLEAQWRMVEALLAAGAHPVVMRSEAIQADAAGAMRRYWSGVGLSDKPEALHWTDAPPADWQQVSGWHKDVMSSSGINPLTAEQERQTEAEFRALVAQAPRMAQLYEHHRGFYGRLAALAGDAAPQPI